MIDNLMNDPKYPADAGHTATASAGTAVNHTISRTGASDVLIALTGFFVVLLLIVIFILQNQASTTISFLWMHGRLPLAVAILLSAITGALLVAIAAGARVLQLRHTAARHRKEERR